MKELLPEAKRVTVWLGVSFRRSPSYGGVAKEGYGYRGEEAWRRHLNEQSEFRTE